MISISDYSFIYVFQWRNAEKFFTFICNISNSLESNTYKILLKQQKKLSLSLFLTYFIFRAVIATIIGHFSEGICHPIIIFVGKLQGMEVFDL